MYHIKKYMFQRNGLTVRQIVVNMDCDFETAVSSGAVAYLSVFIDNNLTFSSDVFNAVSNVQLGKYNFLGLKLSE